MFSALRGSVLFESEEDTFLQEIAHIAEKQGFTSGGLDAFQGSQFGDWSFESFQGEKYGRHKAAIRRLLDCTSGQPESQLGKSERVESHVTDRSDSLKELSELLRQTMRPEEKRKEETPHVQNAKALENSCGNWGSVSPALLPSMNASNLLMQEMKN